jgi:hypothetical protein
MGLLALIALLGGVRILVGWVGPGHGMVGLR